MNEYKKSADSRLYSKLLIIFFTKESVYSTYKADGGERLSACPYIPDELSGIQSIT
jgi:hypothetical protein